MMTTMTSGGEAMLKKNKLKQRVNFLESENKRLQNSNKWMSQTIKSMPVEIREWFVDNGHHDKWRDFASDFELCEHCGFDYTNGEGHHEHIDICPVAFRQMCDDFIDETGNGNSTRSLIWMLHDDLMRRGDERVLSWVDDYHRYLCESGQEEEIELDFDKWLAQQKESGETLSSLLVTHLWTYEQNRECLNEWIVELWIEDFEKETGLKF